LLTDLTYFPTLPYFDMGNSSDSDNDGVNTEWEQQHVSQHSPCPALLLPPFVALAEERVCADYSFPIGLAVVPACLACRRVAQLVEPASSRLAC
jgi:hypothetical protein